MVCRVTSWEEMCPETEEQSSSGSRSGGELVFSIAESGQAMGSAYPARVLDVF